MTEEETTKDVVKKAAQSVGSLSDTEFVIAFNPDVFQPHVRHVDPEVRIQPLVSYVKPVCKYKCALFSVIIFQYI